MELESLLASVDESPDELVAWARGRVDELLAGRSPATVLAEVGTGTVLKRSSTRSAAASARAAIVGGAASSASHGPSSTKARGDGPPLAPPVRRAHESSASDASGVLRSAGPRGGAAASAQAQANAASGRPGAEPIDLVDDGLLDDHSTESVLVDERLPGDPDSGPPLVDELLSDDAFADEALSDEVPSDAGRSEEPVTQELMVDELMIDEAPDHDPLAEAESETPREAVEVESGDDLGAIEASIEAQVTAALDELAQDMLQGDEEPQGTVVEVAVDDDIETLDDAEVVELDPDELELLSDDEVD
ncbi:MAG: hypothetical protein B7733_24340 [Myxococcales bacterium FL481]|nr:MAG: hypothetical protein B7733_24340 [Myxococcales bacterium FL481]